MIKIEKLEVDVEVKTYNEYLNETIYYKKLKSGITCIIIPKNEYIEKQGMIGFNYGSIDNIFTSGNKEYNMPIGIAHFLEHKMFENDNYNVFDKFTELGGSVNAYTNLTNTAYYFKSNENFYECFNQLLDLTSNIFLTEENVNKEKGIIIQELGMYEDNPNWNVYMNMLKSAYGDSPIGKDIGGTEESVNSINIQQLTKCFDKFYTPSNMLVICVGEFSRNSIYETVDGKMFKENNENLIKTVPITSDNVYNKFTCKDMGIGREIFNIGFMEKDFTTDIGKKIVTTKVLLDYIGGPASDFYEDLYYKGLIDQSFAMDYMCSGFFGLSVFAGISEDSEKCKKLLIDRINKCIMDGIDEKKLKNIIKKHKGRFKRNFNSIENICVSTLDLYSKGLSLFDVCNEFDLINVEYATKRLKNHFVEENMVLSVVK